MRTISDPPNLNHQAEGTENDYTDLYSFSSSKNQNQTESRDNFNGPSLSRDNRSFKYQSSSRMVEEQEYDQNIERISFQTGGGSQNHPTVNQHKISGISDHITSPVTQLLHQAVQAQNSFLSSLSIKNKALLHSNEILQKQQGFAPGSKKEESTRSIVDKMDKCVHSIHRKDILIEKDAAEKRKNTDFTPYGFSGDQTPREYPILSKKQLNILHSIPLVIPRQKLLTCGVSLFPVLSSQEIATQDFGEKHRQQQPAKQDQAQQKNETSKSLLICEQMIHDIFLSASQSIPPPLYYFSPQSVGRQIQGFRTDELDEIDDIT